jgi:hypothetical protein
LISRESLRAAGISWQATKTWKASLTSPDYAEISAPATAGNQATRPGLGIIRASA